MTFAETLRAFRKQGGVSQSDLARETNMSHTTFSRYESGDRFPTRDTVTSIADALGLNYADRVRLFLSAGMIPVSVATSEQSVETLTQVICAFKGNPSQRFTIVDRGPR